MRGRCSVWLSALVFVDVQLFDLLLQEGDGHRAATGPVWQRVDLEHRKRVQRLHNEQGRHGRHVLDLARSHLSLRGRVGVMVVVTPSLVLFFRRPHSRVCLGGAIRQRGVARVIFPRRGPFAVVRFVTLREKECLLL